MREIQILFSTPMVRALRAGIKTQTRRLVKPAPQMVTDHTVLPWEGPPDALLRLLESNGRPCPYGVAGDRLWVRETFFAYGRWETRYSEKKRRDEWHFVDMTLECDRAYQYAADDPDVPLVAGRGGALPGWHRRPAIFMPRAASRILLEVVSVRVEHLNACSAADAIAEGLHSYPHEWRDCEYPLPDIAYKPAPGSAQRYSCPVQAYRALWEQINGAGTWDSNPWVWVVEFKRLEARHV